MEGFNKRTDEQYPKRPSYPSILINDKKQGPNGAMANMHMVTKLT